MRMHRIHRAPLVTESRTLIIRCAISSPPIARVGFFGSAGRRKPTSLIELDGVSYVSMPPPPARPDRSPAHALGLASPRQVGAALAGPHWHAPATQVGVAGGHTRPQPPQLDWLICVFTSQPLVGWPSQSAHPVLQVIAHTPPVQLGFPLAEPHTEKQEPQFKTSVCMFTSQPFTTSPSQSARPALQVIVQTPPVQPATPPVLLHWFKHAPQLDVVWRLISQPSAAAALQSANPALQTRVAVHCPPTHCLFPFGTDGH